VYKVSCEIGFEKILALAEKKLDELSTAKPSSTK
jgi:hypothetical protein